MDRPLRFACLVAALAVAAALSVLAQRAAPGAHMTVANPARLHGARVKAVYQAIRGGGPVPAGGIVVKDNFVMTESGEVLTGPL